MSKKTLYMGSDHAGFSLKEFLKPTITELGFEIKDLGPGSEDSVDFPRFAHKVCHEVAKADSPDVLGLLICGTGIGMSMAANRNPKIRAGLCTNEYLARMTRLHNNANVLCLGERVTGKGVAASIVATFLTTEFEGGRHQRRIDMLDPSTCGGD